MKKSLIALSLSTSASPVTISDVVARQNYCADKADDGRSIFVLKHSRTADAMLAQINARGDGKLDDITREINTRTVNYAVNTANNENEAYDGVWTMCMDLLSAGDRYRR